MIIDIDILPYHCIHNFTHVKETAYFSDNLLLSKYVCF